MVQEVERRHPEFDLVVFLEGEVLVNREVAVEESGPLDVRPDQIPILSASRSRETAWVEVLAVLQTAARIASDLGLRDANRVGAQEIRRLHGGRPGYVERPASVGLKRWPALQLCDSRKHPAVGYSCRSFFSLPTALGRLIT